VGSCEVAGWDSSTANALCTAVVVSLFLLRFPRSGVTPDLDPSWSAVLGLASAKGWQFARDIVFTYGPAGYLTTPHFHGYSLGARYAFELVFALLVAAGVCLLAWRLSPLPRWLLLGLFVLFPATLHVGPDLPLEVGLLAWGLLCLLQTGRAATLSQVGLVGLTVLAGLSKFTFLVIGGLTVATVATDLVLRGRVKVALAMLGAFACLWLGGWVGFGQNLGNLWMFVSTQLAVSKAYAQAMGLESAPLLWTGGIVTVSLCLAAVLIRSAKALLPGCPGLRWRRGLLFGWLTLILYLSYKHGFVRANGDLFAGFILTFILAVETIPTGFPKLGRLTGTLAVAACLMAVLMINWKDPTHLVDRPGAVLRHLSFHVGTLLRPDEYSRGMSNSLRSAKSTAQLPKTREIVGNASLDVFGQNQGYAVLNDFNYRPRPVFQSYSTCGADLMRLNERHYEGDGAPQFVLFNLAPIDSRFPPLEDSHVLRRLVTDYTTVGSEGPLLLLKRRSESIAPLRLTIVQEGVIRPGEPIDVSRSGGADLWLEIHLEATTRGKLRAFLAKPAEVRLGVWTSPDAAQQFRAPASMLAAGFLASPLLLNNSDLNNLQVQGTRKQPLAYMVSWEPWAAPFWKEQIHYKLYRLEKLQIAADRR
jgi:hypothetical protein